MLIYHLLCSHDANNIFSEAKPLIFCVSQACLSVGKFVNLDEIQTPCQYNEKELFHTYKHLLVPSSVLLPDSQT